ncbi:MAG: response regulator transcription factor [Bacteroidetes Order II. Incertae sedis bacterium]|nr:response regulator transcription factor [Bacteroidetes Order II. bacterium]
MRILLIEDEPGIASFLKSGFTEQGFEVAQAFDGEMGLKLAQEGAFEVIILDIILPKMTGVEVCKRIRAGGNTDTPILMLTALGTTDDIVLGLDSGADDYLTKPFKFKELLARVRALQRRKLHTPTTNILRISDLELDLDRKEVRRSGILLKLTAREFNLLYFLMRHAGRVVSRTSILEEVWHLDFEPGTNVIDVYVNYLRNKVDKPFKTKLIHTVIGMGYVIKEGTAE